MEAAFLKYVLPALFVMAQALLLTIQMLKNKKNAGQYQYNPHPPGEAQACRDHKDALRSLGGKLEEQGKAIARVEEGQKAQEQRLNRIEGNLNGVR